MLIWVSKNERLAQQQRELQRDLDVAMLEANLQTTEAQLLDQRALVDRLLDVNNRLAASGHDALEVAKLELERAHERISLLAAERDAMDAAMHEKRIEKLVGRSVVIHTAGDHSIEGVLTDVYPDAVVLKHAYYIDAINGGRETLVGEQIVPRPFEFVQELALAGAQNS